MTDNLKVFDVAQGSAEWLAARLGVPTASMMKTVMSKKEDGETRTNYLYQLVAETISGMPQPTWDGNKDTLRGTEFEQEAIDMYAEAVPGEVLTKAGFGIRGGIGASPDLLVGEPGGAEMKCVRGHIQVKRLLKDVVPSEYVMQMQCNMFVWNRQWWDFVSFSPKMPLFVKRLHRDNAVIAQMVLSALDFNREKQQKINQLEGK